MEIVKRDGRVEEFNPMKIVAAVEKAFAAVGLLPDRDPVVHRADDIADMVNKITADVRAKGGRAYIEDIQDAVERALMPKYPDVAKAYILYRQQRAERRRAANLTPDPNAIADYIHPAKYGRWIRDEQRRETFAETVQRVFTFYRQQVAKLTNDLDPLHEALDSAAAAVLEKKILPSMRAMQFAGARAEAHNASIYNCSFSLVDRPRFFAEAFYLLLCGCGVGYRVSKKHVGKLPKVQKMDPAHIVFHTVADTIEGWADAVDVMFDSAFNGYYVEYRYDRVRPAGSPLHTSGGRAPGHIPLRNLLETLRERLGWAEGRHLKPIECHDMICFIAKAVLAGGIRRSSLIALFDLDDEEMMTCKTPKVFRYSTKDDPGLNTQREMANNSACGPRDSFTKEKLAEIIESARNFGDPGFAFMEDDDYGCNPCGEIGLNPTIWRDNTKLTGWSFCNLCEVNVARCTDEEDFIRCCELASVIGTIQASFTSFPYLGEVTEAIAKREALIGVGLTGIMDRPHLGLNPELLRRGARQVIETNRRTAELIGINPAARCTTVKPSGTAALELGCVGSGRHRHHARRYLRRITANPLEPVAQFFRSINPHMVEEKPNGDWAIVFPVKAPDGAPTMKDATALQELEETALLYQNWILPGTARPDSSPRLTHNVSSTVSVSDDEWDSVIEWCWRNREFINSLSFIGRYSDKGIPYMPREEIVDGDAVDEAYWRDLIEKYRRVDYTTMVETEDFTAQAGEVACGGGACEVVHGSMPPTGLGTFMSFDFREHDAARHPAGDRLWFDGQWVRVAGHGVTPVSGRPFVVLAPVRGQQ